MALPNFLIIGVQKAGTTWLVRMLNQHPDIFLYDKNEIQYFSDFENFNKGTEWYEEHFKSAKEHKLIGEKTVSYMWANLNVAGHKNHLPDVHKNIYGLLPDIKLVAVLRNPVERAISHTNYLIKTKRLSPLININDVFMQNNNKVLKEYCVLEVGLYYDQIKAYLQIFKKEQLLILLHEKDIIREPEKGLDKICTFLGADLSCKFKNLREKVYENTHSMPRLVWEYHIPVLRRFARYMDKYFSAEKKRPGRERLGMLYEYYEKPNRDLEGLLNANLDIWNYNQKNR